MTDTASPAEVLCTGSVDEGVPPDDPRRGLDALRADASAWLAEIAKPDGLQSPWLDRGRFPSDSIRDHFLSDERVLEDPIRSTILRALLPQGLGVVGSDVQHLELMLANDSERIRRNQLTEYERRLLRARLGGHRPAPMPDLTWVLDLVEWQPRTAMDAIRAYLLAHGWIANDQVIDGLSDALAFIRRHFICPAATGGHAVLNSLTSRELEYLAGALWKARGFDVRVSRATRDGGYDIEARRLAAGEHVTLLIECRSGDVRQPVSAVRELAGVVTKCRASGGVLVSLGGFTSHGRPSATEEAASDPRMELVDRDGFSHLLSETWGTAWIRDVERHIAQGQRLASGQ